MTNILQNPPTFETSRLIIRPLTMTDDEAIYAYCCDPEVAHYVSFNTHRSIEDTRVFLRSALESYEKQTDPGSLAIVMKEEMKLIGTIGYLNFRPSHKSVEIGYALSRPYWNKGIVTEASKAMTDHFFRNSDLVRIEAQCRTENIGSARVMEKAGMRFEGILRKHLFMKGAHYDTKMFSIIRDDWQRENNN
ncbi:MAG: GNAT family protein [Ignavibacteriota bacterium]